MCEQPGAPEDWAPDTDEIMTTPGKRVTPEMLQRIARARPAEAAAAEPAEPTTDVRGPFDLSDVRRR